MQGNTSQYEIIDTHLNLIIFKLESAQGWIAQPATTWGGRGV